MRKKYIILSLMVAGFIITGLYSLLAGVETASYSVADDETEQAEKKQIAITFDDGPNPYYTMELLDGLKARGVQATFFVLGEEAQNYPEILEAIYEDGHQIGIHSWQHVNFTEIGYAAVAEQIERTQEIIYEITGEYADFIRPPYGIWEDELDKKIPLIEVLWDVDPMDWATNDADAVVKRVEKNAKEGSIILLHDASQSTVSAAFTIIDILKDEGYEFVTVETLILE
jgi:peptidoglycan/xylan/chitin deacetylase (PgdA/CDA1 family)